jgi:hypothetical protein
MRLFGDSGELDFGVVEQLSRSDLARWIHRRLHGKDEAGGGPDDLPHYLFRVVSQRASHRVRADLELSILEYLEAFSARDTDWSGEAGDRLLLLVPLLSEGRYVARGIDLCLAVLSWDDISLPYRTRALQGLLALQYRGTERFWFAQYAVGGESLSGIVFSGLGRLGLRHAFEWLSTVQWSTGFSDLVIAQLPALIERYGTAAVVAEFERVSMALSREAVAQFLAFANEESLPLNLFVNGIPQLAGEWEEFLERWLLSPEASAAELEGRSLLERLNMEVAFVSGQTELRLALIRIVQRWNPIVRPRPYSSRLLLLLQMFPLPQGIAATCAMVEQMMTMTLTSEALDASLLDLCQEGLHLLSRMKIPVSVATVSFGSNSGNLAERIEHCLRRCMMYPQTALEAFRQLISSFELEIGLSALLNVLKTNHIELSEFFGVVKEMYGPDRILKSITYLAEQLLESRNSEPKMVRQLVDYVTSERLDEQDLEVAQFVILLEDSLVPQSSDAWFASMLDPEPLGV